jgi:hypothetical protein
MRFDIESVYDVEEQAGRVVALCLYGAGSEVCAALERDGFVVGVTSDWIAPILRGGAKVGRVAFADNGAQVRLDVEGDVILADERHVVPKVCWRLGVQPPG